MLGRRDFQTSFFDSEIFSRMIPEDHPLVQIAKHVDFSFVTEEVKQLYHPDVGRPSFPPEVLFRVLFLEIWGNLSDVQVCRELKYNVLYRHFCGIGWDDPVPDDTTLVVFRRRLGEETFRRLFARVVEQAKEKGLIRGKWAIVDGTKVIAHAAVKNNVALAREGRKKLLQVLARHDEKLARELEPLAQPERDTDYADHEQLLAAELLKGQELISKLEDRKEEDVVELRELYRKVVQLEGVASLSDPDARWGFKKKDEPFLGYKAHVACDENGVATAVTVTPGNESELPQLHALVEEIKQEGIEPIYLAADKGYDDADTRHKLEESGIRAYIPSRHDLNRLEKLGFAYDRKRQVLVCAAGKCSIGRSVHRNGGFIYYFSERDCMGCQFRSSCLGKSKAPKLVYVKPEVFEHRARGLKRAMKVRKTIERL
ncbi:MAG: IS1182 family transposase, partial [Anaerolineae bacterium]